MGMTIETAIRNLSMYDVTECGNAELHTWYKGIEEDMEESFKVAIDTMRRYQMMELDRKADMVAMLEELQLKFEENTTRWYVGRVDGKSDDIVLMETINNIIQQKIDALKEDK